MFWYKKFGEGIRFAHSVKMPKQEIEIVRANRWNLFGGWFGAVFRKSIIEEEQETFNFSAERSKEGTLSMVVFCFKNSSQLFLRSSISYCSAALKSSQAVSISSSTDPEYKKIRSKLNTEGRM